MKCFVILFFVLAALNSFSQNFYFGNDLSYVNQMEDGGAVYKENMQPKDVYHIFADHGTNLVRVRLWVDPSWWQSPLKQPAGVKSFYNDIVDVTETIRRSKEAGMKVMLDLHFSDFWADPGRQLVPRRWIAVATNNNLLRDSVYNYTKRILTDLNSKGLMPDIVKIGNESNIGMVSQVPQDGNSYEVKATLSTSWIRHALFFNAAIKAVREVGATASINPKIALHFSNKLSGQVWAYQNVINSGITDFDIMGISYYYSWHGGSIKELQSTIESLKSNFPKYQPMVVETGYLWSTENFDTMGNIINDPDPQYLPVSPEKQLEYMVDFTRAVMKGGGIGVVFWEPAWVSTPCRTPWGVGSSHDHVAFFDPVHTNFMDNGGGRWTEPKFYTTIGEKKVTLKVDMTGQDQSRGVYITGDLTKWDIVKMTPEGSNIYSYSKNLIPGDTLAYYYLTTSTWADYLNYREKVPAECALVWNSDRRLIVPEVETQIGVKWASCSEFINTASIPVKETGKITIFPNPASGKININADFLLENATLCISNTNGQVLKQLKLNSANGFETVDVSDIPAGLYLFRLQSRNHNNTCKILLQ